VDDLLSIAVSNAVAATVLALAAIAVGAVYRRPALAHGLWLLVLLKLVTPPLVLIPVSWPTSGEQRTDAPVTLEDPEFVVVPAAEERPDLVVDLQEEERGCVSASRESTTPAAEAPPLVDVLGALTELRSSVPLEPILWPQILRIVWGAGALLWFIVALERVHRFRRLLRFARPAPSAIQERTNRLAQSLGLTRCPRVRLLPGRIAPMLWCCGGPPRLLVPADLVGVLSEEQMDTLLVHELAHLRRRDHWVRVLEFIVMGLYWWHPVVWYALRELREAEEQCCDAWVVSTLTDAGRTYASALLNTLDFLSTTQSVMPPLASGLGRIADLKRRLTMILQGNTPRSLTWPGCLAVMTLGLTCLPMLPLLHGQAPGKEEARKSVEDAKRDLERAKEELKTQEANLKQKLKDLIQAQTEMANETANDEVRKALAQVEKHRGNLVITNGKATIRIEITLPADEGVKPNDIIEKIRKVLPDKIQDKADVRLLPGQHRFVIVPPTPPKTPMPAQPGQPPAARPKPPKAIVPENPSGTPSKSSEKRINDLEKKLEKLLEELQDLRKQMKQPRGGAAFAPRQLRAPGFRIASPGNSAPLAPPAQVAPPAAPPPALAPSAPPGPTPPTPPAAIPAPAPEVNPDPNPDPSAHRAPNPYRDRSYRCRC
jgi:beta-lactamase regulating signal transducer with metallopeptidase domain